MLSDDACVAAHDLQLRKMGPQNMTTGNGHANVCDAAHELQGRETASQNFNSEGGWEAGRNASRTTPALQLGNLGRRN